MKTKTDTRTCTMKYRGGKIPHEEAPDISYVYEDAEGENRVASKRIKIDKRTSKCDERACSDERE